MASQAGKSDEAKCPVPHHNGQVANASAISLGQQQPSSNYTCQLIVPPQEKFDIQFTCNISPSDFKRLIIAKLSLKSSAEFHFKDPNTGYLVLDITPTAFANFSQLEYVAGRASLLPTPGPSGLPIFGNAHQFASDGLAAFKSFAIKFGDTYRMSIFDTRFIVSLDPKVLERVMFESPFFTKKIVGVFKEIQAFSGHGLFTSDTNDPEWEPAHKILLPPFANSSMKMYIPDMNHVIYQLTSVLSALDGHSIDIPEFMTRFTLQTIGMCGFSYDFHLLDKPDSPLHPFVNSMSYCLNESSVRWVNMDLYKKLPIKANSKFTKCSKLMTDIVEQVIAERRACPDGSKTDLLNYMLTAKTPEGQGLPDDNIRDQVLTFLIAGHETTATLLSWCLWILTQHPAIANRVLEEAIRVCGRDPNVPITFQQVAQLKYITQVLKESLRLYPPAPAFFKYCKVSTVVSPGYRVHAGDPLIVDVYGIHRSRKVWGNNPDVFDPNNFSKEEEAKRHPFAFLPFSLGERSCIGLGFALQEAKMALATIVRMFTFEYRGPIPAPYDPDALTLRPKNLQMIVHKRQNVPSDTEIAARAGMISLESPETETSAQSITTDLQKGAIKLKSMSIAFGSNMGTSEEFARQIASTARRFGVESVRVKCLDDWILTATKSDKKDAVTVIVTSTYNGNPPDNATKAANWFNQHLESGEQVLTDLQFAVFGCGNSQWRTFQKFPMQVDSCLESLGAYRLLPLGKADADTGDEDSEFTKWHAHLWVYLQDRFGMTVAEDGTTHPMVGQSSIPESVRVEIVPSSNHNKTVDPVRPCSHLPTKLTVNRELLTPIEGNSWTEGKSTRHLEFVTDQSYVPGDHLEIWPENNKELIVSLANHLKVDLNSAFRIEIPESEGINPKCTAAVLFTILNGKLCTVRDALTYFVDLVGPVGRSLAEVVAERQGKTDVAKSIREFDNNALQAITKQYERAIDAILATTNLDLKAVLISTLAITPRRYSIASSCPGSVKLCVGVQEKGLCTQFLKHIPAGHIVYTLVKACPEFRLPTKPTMPIVMVCAGTGLAPFLGFIEARLTSEGKERGDAHLFFGCRHHDHDHLYKAEMDKWVKEGALTKTHVSYSRPSNPSSDEPKYVQHMVAKQADLIVDLIHQGGACLYVCGSARGMGHDLSLTLEKVFAEKLGVNGAEYCAKLRASGQYCEDVWG